MWRRWTSVLRLLPILNSSRDTLLPPHRVTWESVAKPHAPFLFLFAYVTAQLQPGNMLVCYIGFRTGFPREVNMGAADKYKAGQSGACLRCGAPIPGGLSPQSRLRQ
ncbi:protein of unknown function [Pseudomonas sp. JV551A1]|nr:protein of unknown function [Pseudomonas sp. JV551A1]